jgi:hypothetical protein
MPIILSLKTLGIIVHRVRSVDSSCGLLKQAIDSFFFCYLWNELPENCLYNELFHKNIGPTILLALMAHQMRTFTGWSRTS